MERTHLQITFPAHKNGIAKKPLLPGYKQGHKNPTQTYHGNNI